MAKKYNIGLDIGGTKVLGAVFDEDDNIVHRLKKRTKEGGDSVDNVEEVIISVVEEIMEEFDISSREVNAIGAGAPGVIDQESGVVLFSPNLPWRDYNIRKPIEKRFKVPFYIGNDVNTGVYGEYKYGAGRGYENIVGFFVGTGIGGGLILNGKLFTGNGFKAAEYGHMTVQPDGPLCGCGQRGCLESLASKRAMSAYIMEQAARGRDTLMADKIENGVFKSKTLKKALKEEDEVAMEAVERSCHYLAIATGTMINTISPDLIVYGGGIMESMGSLFMEKIEAQVDKYCMPSIRKTVELAPAALGDDSVLYGALAMIKDA